ncbi:MAG: hypothetical protein EHM20_03165 [Alphaproteobacteria bacterium]|nr:MAG: hypothetical protein EHM20_03165 [Alphaproteobacteria bacterium]
MVNYWLSLFTGTTWEEFQKAGSSVSGFNKRSQKTVDKIESGDIILCYITGVMHWVGALEVVGPTNDARQIWNLGNDSDELNFPVRLAVKPILTLNPEYGVPMKELEGKVSFYESPDDRLKGFRGFIRRSPTKFKENDGNCVFELLKEAEKNPVIKEIDYKKMGKIPLYKVKKGMKNIIVTIPETEPNSSTNDILDNKDFSNTSEHTKIQYYLLNLGSKMGLNVWVAKNDRSKAYNNISFESMPGIVSELPTQFNDATQKTIELIDVLWLKGKTIIAAFEIESTTSIYSGLLRMSDLIALQPNLEIKLYLVAPDARSDKVKWEILRPTFECLPKPLSDICGFISFSDLQEKVTKIQDLGIASYLNPSFLDKVAKYFSVDDEDQ